MISIKSYHSSWAEWRSSLKMEYYLESNYHPGTDAYIGEGFLFAGKYQYPHARYILERTGCI